MNGFNFVNIGENGNISQIVATHAARFPPLPRDDWVFRTEPQSSYSRAFCRNCRQFTQEKRANPLFPTALQKNYTTIGNSVVCAAFYPSIPKEAPPQHEVAYQQEGNSPQFKKQISPVRNASSLRQTQGLSFPENKKAEP